jgi:hypothetical protein
MTYNLFNYHIISLPVLCYNIFLHLKVKDTWNIGYLLHAFQKFRRSRDYNLLAWCLHFDRADFVVHIFIVYIFDFLKEIMV